MYVPSHFAVPDAEVGAMLAGITAAELITASYEGLVATFLPLQYNADRHSLQGHVARNNPHWKQEPTLDSLVIARGPDAYISPNWYPSKADHGRVVPTWNYEVLHIYGTLAIHQDVEWLRELVTRLTDRHESGSPAPWHVSDAPQSYIDGQLRAIVGIELTITRIDAKAKLSQNRSDADQESVIEHLAAGGPMAAAVAERMRTT